MHSGRTVPTVRQMRAASALATYEYKDATHDKPSLNPASCVRAE